MIDPLTFFRWLFCRGSEGGDTGGGGGLPVPHHPDGAWRRRGRPVHEEVPAAGEDRRRWHRRRVRERCSHRHRPENPRPAAPPDRSRRPA